MNNEIEEMKITVLNCFRDENGCKNCKYFNGIYCTSYSLGVAEALYNAGYRKAEDVRKETAREILQKVGNMKDNDGEYFYKDYQWFVRLCKEYGVEVKE